MGKGGNVSPFVFGSKSLRSVVGEGKWRKEEKEKVKGVRLEGGVREVGEW